MSEEDERCGLYDTNEILFVILSGIIFLWFCYVLKNGYPIKIKHLRPIYYTFMFHCGILLLNPVVTLFDVIDEDMISLTSE